MEIFLLEDDLDIVNLIKKYLDRDFLLTTCTSINDAQKIFQDKVKPKIFILDEQLPDGSGIEFCSKVRNDFDYKSYIIILTKNNSLDSKLNAYQLGADEYITKPFNILELSAKLKNISTRIGQLSSSNNFKTKYFYFDLSQMEVFSITSNKQVGLGLTPKEFLILKLLAQNEGQLFTRNQIIDKVWGELTSITDRTIDQHITHIRKKISNPLISIESVRGEGYRLNYK